jgi:hypothetical protein
VRTDEKITENIAFRPALSTVTYKSLAGQKQRRAR